MLSKKVIRTVAFNTYLVGIESIILPIMKRQLRPVSFALLISFLIFSCTVQEKKQETPPLSLASVTLNDLSEVSTTASDDTIRVGIYPYVPDTTAFINALTAMCDSLLPYTPVKIRTWDCYSEDPPANLDVFVFDAIYTSYFIEQDYLMPFSMDQLLPNYGGPASDYLPYSLDACRKNPGDSLVYALPQIGCTNMSFYRKTDANVSILDAASSMATVANLLGPASYTSYRPPANEGLLFDLSGGTTSACVYVQTALESGSIPYSWYPTLPAYTNLDPKVIALLQDRMVIPGGVDQVSYYPANDTAYVRGLWYDQGSGRVLTGFTETASQMPNSLSNLNMRLIPVTPPVSGSMFYTDVIGLNTNINSFDKLIGSFVIMQIMASNTYLTASFGTGGKAGNPQYLMPVRYSVLDSLSTDWPFYGIMKNVVTSANAQPFRLGTDVRTWLTNNKSQIRDQILAIPKAENPNTK